MRLFDCRTLQGGGFLCHGAGEAGGAGQICPVGMCLRFFQARLPLRRHGMDCLSVGGAPSGVEGVDPALAEEMAKAGCALREKGFRIGKVPPGGIRVWIDAGSGKEGGGAADLPERSGCFRISAAAESPEAEEDGPIRREIARHGRDWQNVCREGRRDGAGNFFRISRAG